MRHLAAATLLVLLLSGCGDDEPDVAGDPGSSSADPTPSEEPSESGYPDFEPASYTYTLAVSCFCPDAGTPIAVTVVDNEVTQAVLAADGTGRGGGEKGDRAADYLWLTIDDIIDEARSAEAGDAASVQVTWPEGQDYPSSVYIDRSKKMVDEEIGYTIAAVVVGPSVS